MKKPPTRFTFRRLPRETGLASVGRPWPDTEIKLGGRDVGLICSPSWSSDGMAWRVCLRIAAGESWENKRLKAQFENEDAARAFLNEHFAALIELGLSPETDD
jgi:hypothetical protein